MTIIMIIRGGLALGLVCSAVVPLLFHTFTFFFSLYYHTDCGNCVFIPLVMFFSMVLFNSGDSDTWLDFMYRLLRDTAVHKPHDLCSVLLKVLLGCLVDSSLFW